MNNQKNSPATSLRKLMINEIKEYYWLDYYYGRPDLENAKEYMELLENLSDQEFLAKYNTMTKKIDSLE